MEAQPSIENMPERLGFSETEELRLLHEQLVTAFAGGDENVGALVEQYQLLAQAAVDPHDEHSSAKALIGLMVQMGLIRREAGRREGSLDDFYDARDMAHDMEFYEIYEALQAAIDAMLA